MRSPSAAQPAGTLTKGGKGQKNGLHMKRVPAPALLPTQARIILVSVLLRTLPFKEVLLRQRVLLSAAQKPCPSAGPPVGNKEGPAMPHFNTRMWQEKAGRMVEPVAARGRRPAHSQGAPGVPRRRCFKYKKGGINKGGGGGGINKLKIK